MTGLPFSPYWELVARLSQFGPATASLGAHPMPMAPNTIAPRQVAIRPKRTRSFMRPFLPLMRPLTRKAMQLRCACDLLTMVHQPYNTQGKVEGVAAKNGYK